MTQTGSRLLRYATVGGLTLAIYIGLGQLLHHSGLSVPWQASLSFIAAVAFNYLLQRSWVFEDSRSARDSLPKYVLMIAVGYAINLATLFAISYAVPLLAAQLAAVVLVVLWNAALSFCWVFLADARSRGPAG